MSEPTNPPDQTDNLQFDTATFSGEAPATTCSVCQQPITDVYFSANDKIVCPRCKEGIIAATAGGSRFVRFSSALFYGVLAAIGAGLIWWLIRRLTGYEIGLIAILVGLMVGGAVRHGARRRGGIGYQLLAVFLTYACIVSTYIPDVYQGLKEHVAEKRAVAATQPEKRKATTAAAGASSAPTTATASAADDEPEYKSLWEGAGPGKRILLWIVFGLILFVIAAVAPILAGFQNIIGLLIIGFALWEAWKINKRLKIAFTGPFAVGAAPPPSPPGIAPAGHP